MTWRAFYGAYEAMLGRTATISMSVDEANACYESATRPKGLLSEAIRVASREIRRRETVIHQRLEMSRLGRSALAVASRWPAPWPARAGRADSDRQDSPIHPLPPAKIAFAAARTRVRIDKAQERLGYRPEYDLERGMAMTESWARHANLLCDMSV